MGPCTVTGVSENHLEIIQKMIITYSNDLNHKFTFINTNPYSVYFAKDLEDFYNESGKSTPNWAFGITRNNRIIMQYPQNIRTLKQLLIHELNHVYINKLPRSHTIPKWFKEGMAVNESGEFSFNNIIVFSTAKWNNKLFTNNELSNFKTVNKSNSQIAYAQSYIMFKALSHYYHPGIYHDIIEHINRGNDFWESLVYLTGDSKPVIRNNIAKFVDSEYNWMFLFNRYNLIFMFLPLILILGYIYKR